MLIALRKDAAHRYASARNLADDINRRLARRPVHGRRGAWAYRAGRFMWRHRGAMVAALVANVAVVLGLGVAIYQAREAGQNLAQIRKLANNLVFEVSDAIERQPGNTAARKLVLERALNYLRQLEARSEASP